MTEEETKETDIFFEKKDVAEMFNTSFLPKLQEIARTVKEKNHPDEELAFFNVQMKNTSTMINAKTIPV